MLPGNVRIKLEPGTSKLNMLQTNVPIKIEPNSSERLTSLKIPRDLKLTSTSKNRIFKPNLNVTRNKRNEVASPTLPQNVRGRGRGRGRGGERGRGGRGGKNNQAFIQSKGVFSEGIADTMKRNVHTSDRSVESRDSDVFRWIDKPTINKNKEWKIDKEHEDMVMKELLDDHIDPDHEIINDLNPIQLPISKGAKCQTDLFKVETSIKTENLPCENGINESMLFDIKERLLLFQFPDALPGIGQVKEPSTKKTDAPTNNQTEETTAEVVEKNEIENRCTIRDINEGMLGRIVIYKSGKACLIIGNNKFNVETGPDPGFLQDVMSVPVNVNTRSGDMINLGSVDGSAVISPVWDDLITK